MPLSIHQRAAITWLLASSVAFAPLLHISKRPDVGLFLAQGIGVVTVIIAVIPLLLKWPRFRRWFCWTDALSCKQREAIAQRDLRRFYQVGFEEQYLVAVLPYMKRVLIVTVGLIAIPKVAALPVLEVTVFAALYPLAILSLMLASSPIARILRARP